LKERKRGWLAPGEEQRWDSEGKPIVTKRPGWCKACKQRVPVGADALWIPGEGIRHAGCGPQPVAVTRISTGSKGMAEFAARTRNRRG
jgi:hypothetical protein